MALTTSTQNGSGALQQRGGGPRIEPPGDARRRPVRALVLVVVAVAFASAFAFMLVKAGDRQPVLAMARTVPAGAVITPADITVVNISTEQPLLPIPANARGQVVGATANSTLVAGTLVTKAHLGERLVPGPSESVVGILLKGVRVAPSSLRAGDRVQVVQTSTPTDRADAPGEAPPLGTVMAAGRVLSVTDRSDSSGSVELAVAVDAGLAPSVAGAAAADRVNVVLVGQAG